MKKTILIYLFCAIALLACDDENPGPYAHSTDIGIRVIDEEGNDLLNPDKVFPNSINPETIKIYYLIDGKEVLYSDAGKDAPRGYKLEVPELEDKYYRLVVYLNSIITKSHITETIIEWDSTHRDTIKAEYLDGVKSKIVDKVWLNEALVWGTGVPNTDLVPKTISVIW